jgi:hypothetical protein
MTIYNHVEQFFYSLLHQNIRLVLKMSAEKKKKYYYYKKKEKTAEEVKKKK